MDLDLYQEFRSVILRYFNAAGADPEGRLGEWHSPETHAIPIAIETALGNRSHFEILGTDYAEGVTLCDNIGANWRCRSRSAEQFVAWLGNSRASVLREFSRSCVGLLTTCEPQCRADYDRVRTLSCDLICGQSGSLFNAAT